MTLTARVGRLEGVAGPAREEASLRARARAVLSDPRVRPLVDRVEAAYAAEPREKRLGDWQWRVRNEQPAIRLAWLVVRQIVAERAGAPPLPWRLVLPETRRAAAVLRREAGLGEMPPEAAT